jgi:hypothetical protein
LGSLLLVGSSFLFLRCRFFGCHVLPHEPM